VYQLDGFDDQCGAGTRASVTGLAYANPSGTIGFGLTIVTTPGATAVHLEATITLATVSGTWRDSRGESGPWVFTPGAGAGGSPRPARFQCFHLSVPPIAFGESYYILAQAPAHTGQ
jgi:hypothetical protein